MRLKGKIAVVTGAGGGIGRAVARRFAEEGATVIVTDLNEDNARAVCNEIQSQYRCDALALKTDVTSPEEIRACVQEVLTRFGRIDILVNNAGGSAGLLNKLTDFAESEPHVWNWVLQLNLHGSMHFVREVLPGMLMQKSGKIINVFSIAALVGIRQRADYSAAKAGMLAFSKTIAMEAGPNNVQINCVLPGMVERAPAGTEEAEQ